jgi:hypothetical protein
MYESPSMHLELARLRHRDFEIEAERARLAAQVPHADSQALALVVKAVAGLRNALSRRRPASVPELRLQPTG